MVGSRTRDGNPPVRRRGPGPILLGARCARPQAPDTTQERARNNVPIRDTPRVAGDERSEPPAGAMILKGTHPASGWRTNAANPRQVIPGGPVSRPRSTVLRA